MYITTCFYVLLMETCFEYRETFKTFICVLQNVFKPYMNECVTGYMFDFLFLLRDICMVACMLHALVILQQYVRKQ